MEPQVIHIPANYTDAGKLLGMFEIRNTIEAAILSAPIMYLVFALLPFSLTVRIITAAVFVIPIGGFSLLGINDYSLMTFLRIYIKWCRAKRILTYKGGAYVEKKKHRKSKTDA